jgi:hypothetical protein
MFKQESDDFEFLFRKNGYPNGKKKKHKLGKHRVAFTVV